MSKMSEIARVVDDAAGVVKNLGAAGAEIAYNKAAQGIVERLERELVEVHQRLDIAERERDECNAKYAKLQQVMMEMATKMLTVQGLQELGHTVIDRLKDEQWREDAL